MNAMSRYHIAIEAVRRAERFRNVADCIIADLRSLIEDATQYAYDHLEDPPEIANWRWQRPGIDA